MSSPEQESIVARIAVLETQNRRLRWMTLGLGALVVAGVCLSFLKVGAQAKAPAPKPKAEKLVLHDASGKERIVLMADKDKSWIDFFDSNGKPVSGIICGRRGSSLVFGDSKGIPRLALHATDAESGFNLMDEKSTPRVEINTKGKPLLLFRDEKGRKILEVLKAGPKLTFFDKDGKPLFTKP